MDLDLNSIMAVQQEAAHSNLQVQTQSVVQQLAQSANQTMNAGKSAECSLGESAGWMAGRLADNTAENDAPGAVAQWQETAGEVLDGAQQAAESFFRIIEAALQTASPDVQQQFSQIASQVADLFQDLAQALDQQGTQLSAEVGYAVYNDAGDDQIVQMLDAACRDAVACKDQFINDMSISMQKVDSIIVDQFLNSVNSTDPEIDAGFAQMTTTDAGLQQYGISINVDEMNSVNENNPDLTHQDRMDRALDMLLSRQFLDPMTNQATKNNLQEVSINRDQMPAMEVSVKDDPSALFTRQWKDIPEMRQVCEDVLKNVRTEGREPTAVKEDVNRRLISEIKAPTTDAGTAVNEALRTLLRKEPGDNEFFRTERLNREK